MKYYRTKLHEDYVDSYDSLDDEELEKEQDEELSKIIENSSIEFLLDNFKDIIEQSMGYLAELRSRNPYGPVCKKLCQNLYGHLSQIWMAVNNDNNQNAEFCIEYNKVSGKTNLLRKKPYDLYGVSTSVMMFSFEEFGEYLVQNTDTILRLSKQYKMYEDISLFYAEMKNIPENKSIMDDSHKKYKTIIESVALSKTEFVQAIYLRLLMISFCYKYWYKMFYNLNKKIGYEIISKAVDSIIDEIKSDIPRPISNNSKVNEDYVSSYDDIDDEELEKEQDEELSKIIEDAGIEVVFKDLNDTISTSIRYLNTVCSEIHQDKTKKQSLKKLNFCISLYKSLEEIYMIVDRKINYQNYQDTSDSYKLYKHNSNSSSIFLFKKTIEFGIPGWSRVMDFGLVDGSCVNVYNIVSLMKNRFKKENSNYSDIEIYWKYLNEICNTGSNTFTNSQILLSDKQLLQVIYFRLLIISFSYKKCWKSWTNSDLDQNDIDEILDHTVDFILNEFKPNVPKPKLYNTSEKVNEDYVNSYDSDDDIIPSMDSILKEAGDEFILDSLKELFDEEKFDSTVNNFITDTLSLTSKFPNHIRMKFSRSFNINHLLERTIDMLNTFYKNSRSHIELIKCKKNNGIFVIKATTFIDSTLSVIDNLFSNITYVLGFVFNNNNLTISKEMTTAVQGFIKNYTQLVMNYFIDPMKDELEKLKRMAEVQ